MSFRSWRTILFFKDCFDKFLYAWKLEEISVVEQIISSNNRITTAIQIERGHYKFDLSSSSWIAYERSLQEAMQCSAWFSGYYDMTDDGRRHLVGYWQPCRPDVSHGALSSFLGNLRLWRRNLRWAMSIKSDGATFLTITCIRICLKMNQRPSRQRRSVPRWRTQLRRRILKQRWVDWFLLSYTSLTHFCVQELPEIEPITSTTKEPTSVEDQVTETNSKAAVR